MLLTTLLAVIAAGVAPQQLGQLEQIIRDELPALPGISNVRAATVSDEECVSVDGTGLRRLEPEVTSLILNATLVRGDVSPEEWWKGSVTAGRTNEPPLGFSDYRIGERSRRHASNGSISLNAHDGDVFITSKLAYRSVESPSGTQWFAPDRPGDKVLIEGLLRRTLARARGLAARPANAVSISGHSVEVVFGPRGERLVDLAGYCQAKGAEIQWNHRGGMASFNDVVVPLASRGIKSGSTWLDTDDISLIYGTKWFVSLEALSAAHLGRTSDARPFCASQSSDLETRIRSSRVNSKP